MLNLIINQAEKNFNVEGKDIKELSQSIIETFRNLDTEESVFVSGSLTKDAYKNVDNLLIGLSISFDIENKTSQSSGSKAKMSSEAKMTAMGLLDIEVETKKEYLKLLEEFRKAEQNMKNFVETNHLYKASGGQNVPLAVGINIGNAIDGFPKGTTDQQKQKAFQELIHKRQLRLIPKTEEVQNN